MASGVTPSPSVQPRVCGERPPQRAVGGKVNGSAPRVRGTGTALLAGIVNVRFSPACAGNGLARAFSSKARPVQPRVCGERR